MATLNELIAALNAKSDSMLANAAKLNTTADNMNQTLDRDQTESFTTTNVVDDPQTEVGLTGTGEPIMGTDIPAPRNFLSDTVDAVKDYIQGGGMIGIVARGIGSLLPERDPRQTALDNFYGSVSNGTIQSGLMAGYNPVSGGALNFLTGGRLGEPTNYGLQRAYQKRIDTRTDPKTLARIAKLSQEKQDAFAQKTKDLQRAKIEESMMLDRVNRDTAYRDDIGDSYSGSYDVRDDTSYSDPFDLGGGE